MTTRDSDAIEIEKWGSAAAGTNFTAPPDLTDPFDQEDGWPVRYATAGGDNPEREVFNWWWRGISALVNEVNTRGGILPWDTSIDYVHPALVFGSDGNIYHSVQDNTGEDPTTDATDANWTLLPSAIASQIADALDTEIGNTDWRTGGSADPTNLSITRTGTQVTIRSSTGDDVVIPEANTTNAGVMSNAHHDKLDGIETGATADQSNSEIKTAYEANADTNALTDALLTTLSGTRIIRSGTDDPDDSVGSDGDLYLQRS